jgi:nucleoside-diphosphate-sugar epimerase
MDGIVKGTRCLITGSGGFIGSHLTRLLLAEGAEVYAMIDDVSSTIPVRLADVAKDVHFTPANLTDGTAMKWAVEESRPEIVFHLGAYTHVGKSFSHLNECVQTNVQGTTNLLMALQGHDYRRFVYASTSEVYGDIDVPFVEDATVSPVSPYSVTKYAGELMCRMFRKAYGWPIVVVRPFNAYGPAQAPDRIIPETIVRALLGMDIPLTEGQQTREFNYVEDIAEGFLKAGFAGPEVDGEVINLGCGEEKSMREMVETVMDVMGWPVKPLFGELPHRPTEIWRMYCDNTKARELLDWKPQHSLEEGLRKTVDWYAAEAEKPNSTWFTPIFSG